MASFDPREWMKKEESPGCIVKLPLHKLEPTLRKFIHVAIPTDLQRLQKHQINIERHIYTESWHELNIEQINASRTVQQLRATIRELDKTKNQIREEDLAAFESKIAPIKKQAIDAICCFGDLEKSLVQKMANKENTHDQYAINNSTTAPVNNEALQMKGDLTTIDASAASASWDELRESLVDLNGIIHNFSDIVHQQQEKIDSISDNIDSSQSHVRSAVVQLGQANKLKAAMIPITGAVVGGLIAGPIGLLAGFKLAGVAAAVGGTFAGYQGGKIIKKKRDDKIDSALENLSENSLEMKGVKDKSA